MKTLALLIVCLLVGCASSQVATNVQSLRELYSFSISVENAVAVRDREAEWRRHSIVQSKGWEFWQAYANEKKRIGSKRALNFLTALIAEKGASLILIVPVLNDFRGEEENRLINQLLTSGAKTTGYLSQILGSPPDLQKIEAYRRGRTT